MDPNQTNQPSWQPTPQGGQTEQTPPADPQSFEYFQWQQQQAQTQQAQQQSAYDYQQPQNTQQQAYDYQQPQYQSYAPYPAQKSNGKAIASMVLGIVSLVFYGGGIVTAIIGLILGVQARKEIELSGGQAGGGGMAKAGVIMCIVALALWGIVILTVCSAGLCAAVLERR